MAVNTAPIYPIAPYAVSASLAAVTACTTRAPTVTASLAAANIIAFVPISANGLRIDKIQVQACSSSITAATVAQTVLIWMWDGTTAYVIDEIQVSAVTPSTTAAAFGPGSSTANGTRNYTNLVLPPAFALYASTTVTTTASTTALSVIAFGGSY